LSIQTRLNVCFLKTLIFNIQFSKEKVKTKLQVKKVMLGGVKVLSQKKVPTKLRVYFLVFNP